MEYKIYIIVKYFEVFVFKYKLEGLATNQGII